MPLYIIMPCKPLVKQYIQNRYGNPVQFPHNDWLRALLISKLQRPGRDHESKLSLQYHTQEIGLPILMREYERYGNELTRTSIMHINQHVQDIVEEVLYNYLHLFHRIAGQSLETAIAGFRTQYNFPEHSYSTDAIKKYWQRASKKRIKITA